MGKARWSDPQGVDRIRQQKLIATAVAEAVGETATDVAVQRCFPRNVTTLPPLPGVLTLAEGAFGYYVDSMPVVSDGHTAWMVSGSVYGDAVDALNSPYYADHAYGLPFILPFDLDHEVWLDPIPIPNPPLDVFDPPPPPAWTEGGTITERAGWLAFQAADSRKALGIEWVLPSPVPSGVYVVPAYTPPVGWTALFTKTYAVGPGRPIPASPSVHSGDAITENGGDALSNTLSLVIIPTDQTLISDADLTGPFLPGPSAPPQFAGADAQRFLQYVPPQPTVGQVQGIWGAEGMFAGLIGRKIYFGGGDGDIDYAITGSMLASYDLDTGEFDWTLPNLPGERVADFSPYAVADGKLWVAASAPYNYLDRSLCCFDPITGVWTTLPSTIPDGMEDQMKGVQVGRTILWPVNTSDASQVSYDIDTDTWDTSAPHLGINDTPASVAVASDGRIWVVGSLYDGSTQTRSVITRIIEMDGTVTIPGSDDLRFDGPAASGNGDLKYGVLPLPDGTFATATYIGLAFRSSDGKPYLIGGTTVKTAELDTVHLPYLHANATALPLGDGSVETVQIGTLPTDRTKLAAIAPDGTASAVKLASDPVPPPLPGMVVTHDNTNGTRLRHADSDGNPLDGSAEYRLLDDQLVIMHGDNVKARVLVYPISGAQLNVESHDADDPSRYGSAEMDGYSRGDESQARMFISASTSRDNLFVGQDVTSNLDQGGFAETALAARDHDYNHESSVVLSAGRTGSFRPGAALLLNSIDGPAFIYVNGVNGSHDPISFDDPATGHAFHVHANGDIDTTGDLLLISPAGNAYRLKVADDGTLTTEVVS